MNKIKIVGDLMLDEWNYGSMQKNSAEAKIKFLKTGIQNIV